MFDFEGMRFLIKVTEEDDEMFPLPIRYHEKIQREGFVPSKLYLTIELSEKVWKVKVEYDYVLSKGWQEFALYHAIKHEDTLLFSRTGKNSWSVSIFAPDGFNVRYHKGKSGNTPLKIGETSRRDVGEDDINDEEPTLDQELFNNVYVLITHTVVKFEQLNLPKEFTDIHNLGAITSMMLHEKNGEFYVTTTGMERTSGRIRLSTGIKAFVEKCGLKAGDTAKLHLYHIDDIPCLKFLETIPAA